MLVAVLVLGSLSFGAKLAITIHGITFQPSEFVKILFVSLRRGMLKEDHSLKRVAVTTGIAAAYVLVLVGSKDLGGALIFFVTYLVMLYVATVKILYFFAGLIAGSAAAWAACGIFAHVRARVLAWSDPFSVIENEGYQITQSLFAIGTGVGSDPVSGRECHTKFRLWRKISYFLPYLRNWVSCLPCC